MNTQICTSLAATGISLIFAALLLPLLSKASLRWGLTDKPGGRKNHRNPTPVIGGLGILLTLAFTALAIPDLRSFLLQSPVVSACLVVISITGAVDDRINMDARKRLWIELGCSIAIAHSGIRIYSLHGFMGIEAIPQTLQYLLTIIIITGITNAFNLLDGIDGLAGSIGFINCMLLACVSFMLHQYSWGLLMLVLNSALLVFLRYNWQPARMFMGDAGSLLLGFIMSISAIQLLHASSQPGQSQMHHASLAVALTACFMIPVIDTLRVFIQRILAGKSPFSADRTHLHHKLIAHFLRHKDASKKLAGLHLSLILSSMLLYPLMKISLLVLLQVLLVAGYTFLLDFAQQYSRWYRQIKRMESNN